MNDLFKVYFAKKFPGMSLDGPNAKSEFETWSDGYIAGMNRACELFTKDRIEEARNG